MKRIKAPSHLQNPKNPASCACRNQGSSSDLYSFCPDSVSHSVGHLHFSYHRSWPDKFKRQGHHDYKASEKNTKRTKRKQRKHNIDNMKMTQNETVSVMQSPPPSPTPSIVAIGVTSTGSATCTTVFLLETNENHRCASRLGGLCQGSLSSFSSGGRCLMIFSYSNLLG